MAESNGRWVTINGAHVFIEKGQSVNDALDGLSKGKRGKKRISNGKHEYSVDDGKSWFEMGADAYGEYDADPDDFDRNVDDDFGFDEEEEMFDEYGLSTEKGLKDAKDFLERNGIEDPYSLSNEEFNALARKAQEEFGIEDFELAQEFLVAPIDERKEAEEAGKNPEAEDEEARLQRIVDERVKQGWDQKGTHDAQSIKDTGYLGFGSLDALEKATFGSGEPNEKRRETGTKTFDEENVGKHKSKKDKYGNPMLSDEAREIGVEAMKKYIEEYGGHKKLKSSNIYVDALMDAASDAITDAGLNPNFDITNEDFNEMITEATGDEIDISQSKYPSHLDAWKAPENGSVDERLSGYKPKKDYGIYGEVLKGDDRKYMEDLAKAFTDAGLKTTVGESWQDYGAGVKWTSPVSNNTQLLTPREWGDYMSGRVTADELIEKKKNDQYWSKYFGSNKAPETPEDKIVQDFLKANNVAPDSPYALSLTPENKKFIVELMKNKKK